MGFEPMVPLRHNCLAGSPIQPLSHLSKRDLNNDGGSRIRTHGTSRHNGFQDRRFRPLSHPTKQDEFILPEVQSACQGNLGYKNRPIPNQPFDRITHRRHFKSPHATLRPKMKILLLFNWQVQGLAGIIRSSVKSERQL